jgi:hypothetical protein
MKPGHSPHNRCSPYRGNACRRLKTPVFAEASEEKEETVSVENSVFAGMNS